MIAKKRASIYLPALSYKCDAIQSPHEGEKIVRTQCNNRSYK